MSLTPNLASTIGSGGEMRLYHVRGHPQGVGCDRKTWVEAGAGREERSVDHVQVVHFVCAVLRIQHAGGGISAESARAADVAGVRVVFAASQREYAKWLQHSFQLPQEYG